MTNLCRRFLQHLSSRDAGGNKIHNTCNAHKILRVLPSSVEWDYGQTKSPKKHHVLSKKIPRAVLLRSKAHAELPLPAMPTLVWRCRPNSGAGAAAGGDSDILLSRREASAVPDPVVSASAAAVPNPARVVPPRRCVEAL